MQGGECRQEVQMKFFHNVKTGVQGHAARHKSHADSQRQRQPFTDQHIYARTTQCVQAEADGPAGTITPRVVITSIARQAREGGRMARSAAQRSAASCQGAAPRRAACPCAPLARSMTASAAPLPGSPA